MTDEMLSQKPYLLRAFFDWIIDSGCSPYIMVNANYPKVEVPREHVNEEGQIVFNVLPTLVKELDLDKKYIYFKAQFSGVEQSIYIPIQAVLAIYAKENGQGMMFEEEEPPVEDGSTTDGGAGFLKIVK